MRASALAAPLAVVLSAAPVLAAPPDASVRMLRLTGGRAGSASVVRLERKASGSPVAVTVVAGSRSRLFLRRSQPEPGRTVYEAWLDSRPGVTVTRAGSGPLLLEAGGLSLRIHEADLGLRTVRCWIGALTSRMEPRLLTAAADVKVLKEWAGKDRLGDEFLPVRILWSVGEAPNISPGGDLEVEEGPFEGAPWDDLVRAVTDELGKP
jgi:hypothetical protein